jgi:ADP-ribosylglycohydrolase
LNSLFVAKNAKDLTEATHLNNIIGGDNCSRALVIGAIFGAVGHVEDIIPADWIAKVNPKVWAEIEETSQQIAAENPTWKN